MAAEAKFRAWVAGLGGEVIEPRWLGAHRPHRIRCAAGHETTQHPSGAHKGRGLCRVCAGQDPATAEAEFRARVAELGGAVIEPQWLGSNRPHRIRCAAGHEAVTRPTHVRQGIGICRTCAGLDPAAAEAAFRARVVEVGGEVIETRWLGADQPHRIRCAAGHEAAPRPTDVHRGQGVCRACGGMVWDVLYVVVDEVEDVVKFGITSGDPRPRLARHYRDGFERVERIAAGLPGETAPRLERTILAALADAGEAPVRGREYFPGRALALILDLIDNHPDVRGLTSSARS
ncbi:hypothetical protein [Streptomyces erythrochromogenes]|uniref:hypothetical protein n=1 Tax=Streptomyces erythrochromogenes TaxID=285574 RepID=UPI003866D8D3|nr:hypothetical protein OG364_29495 [Streptomyces erythrochromogenes]